RAAIRPRDEKRRRGSGPARKEIRRRARGFGDVVSGKRRTGLLALTEQCSPLRRRDAEKTFLSSLRLSVSTAKNSCRRRFLYEGALLVWPERCPSGNRPRTENHEPAGRYYQDLAHGDLRLRPAYLRWIHPVHAEG